MKLLNTLKSRERMVAWFQIVLGCVIGGAAYPMFLTPNNIAPGGLTGVAMIINYLFQLPVGIVSFVLNIPLFIVGWQSMGRLFAIRSLGATLLFSLAIDYLPLKPLTDDPLLGTLYGGILLGAGLGFIMRGGATTGGTDMIARMVHKRFSFISTGMFLFAIDCVVVIAAGFTMGMSEALLDLICIFACAKVMDMVMLGITSRKACFIISDKYELIKKKILGDMERGVTELVARGGYSGKERPVLYCVVNNQEIARMKDIVRDADPSAFVTITDAHEAIGEGFSPLDEEN